MEKGKKRRKRGKVKQKEISLKLRRVKQKVKIKQRNQDQRMTIKFLKLPSPNQKFQKPLQRNLKNLRKQRQRKTQVSQQVKKTQKMNREMTLMEPAEIKLKSLFDLTMNLVKKTLANQKMNTNLAIHFSFKLNI